MAELGSLFGAVLGQALFYEILRWGGGTSRAHPYRQILVFNLMIAGAAILMDHQRGAAHLLYFRLIAALLIIAVHAAIILRKPIDDGLPAFAYPGDLGSKDRSGAKRIAAMVGITVLGAIGAAILYAATASYSDGPFLVLVGMLFLIPCLFLYRYLSQTTAP